ncbi:hypothetical protein [Demequina litorisediminis]|nr:hypothetical protein [Demequina litorisediminis]
MVTQIVDGLAKRLRDRGSSCATVVLRLRYRDFTKATRSRTLTSPTDRTDVLLGVTQSLARRRGSRHRSPRRHPHRSLARTTVQRRHGSVRASD